MFYASLDGDGNSGYNYGHDGGDNGVPLLLCPLDSPSQKLTKWWSLSECLMLHFWWQWYCYMCKHSWMDSKNKFSHNVCIFNLSKSNQHKCISCTTPCLLRLYKQIHKKHHKWTASIALVAVYAHPGKIRNPFKSWEKSDLFLLRQVILLSATREFTIAFPIPLVPPIITIFFI